MFVAKLTGVAKRRLEPEKQSSRLVDWFGLDAEARKVWRFERPEFVVVSPGPRDSSTDETSISR